MREIKFRAWNKKDNVMLDWFCLRQTAFNRGNINLMYDVMCNLNPSRILMQYTGLKDKNGKEIYEGDLVEFEYISHMNIVKRIKRVVFYDETFARFSTAQENDEDGEYLDEGVYMKIIGNIHENQELLKEPI